MARARFDAPSSFTNRVRLAPGTQRQNLGTNKDRPHVVNAGTIFCLSFCLRHVIFALLYVACRYAVAYATRRPQHEVETSTRRLRVPNAPSLARCARSSYLPGHSIITSQRAMSDRSFAPRDAVLRSSHTRRRITRRTTVSADWFHVHMAEALPAALCSMILLTWQHLS